MKEGDLFLFFISDANHVRASVHQKRDFQAPYINTILEVERSWGRYLTKCLSLRSIFDASLKFILSLVNFEPFDHFFLQWDIFKSGLWWPSNGSRKDVWILYIYCLYCPPNRLLLSYSVFFPETSTHDVLENGLREDLFAKKTSNWDPRRPSTKTGL